jgi:putative peptide zinc metalloprotease protein
LVLVAVSETLLSSSWYRIASLKPRLRSHVQIHAHRYLGETWYVLQDSATARAHRFTAAAYAVIGLMNGERTIEEIWDVAGRDLGEHAPTQNDVVQLLSQLHQADVLQIDRAPEVAATVERSKKQKLSNLTKNLRNPLSITVPLWNPDAFLERSVRVFRGVPFGLVAIVWTVVVGVGLVLGLLHLREPDREHHRSRPGTRRPGDDRRNLSLREGAARIRSRHRHQGLWG